MGVLDQPDRDLVGYGADPPRVEWPGGARIAVSLAIAYEEGSEQSRAAGDEGQEQLGESAYPAAPGYRDYSMESVYQYGSRAGVWRLLRVLDEHDVRATFFCSAAALELNPAVAEAIAAGGHEAAGHGWRWQEPHTLTREQERDDIARAVASIERTVGTRPRGWISRTVRSPHTRELLAEEGGFVYDSDAFDDDLPYVQRVGERDHLVLPYTMVLNDARYVVAQGFASPSAFLDTATHAFDRLWHEGAQRPRMMTIGMHPRWSGQPARAAALAAFVAYAQARGAWIARRIDIAEHWLAQRGG
ncbi:MAG TPA: polysaccharide deacetylase family protein [Conexibacter sp.]|nr:polysaccharide deacetylase family protein [Conexibacter sp.]